MGFPNIGAAKNAPEMCGASERCSNSAPLLFARGGRVLQKCSTFATGARRTARTERQITGVRRYTRQQNTGSGT